MINYRTTRTNARRLMTLEDIRAQVPSAFANEPEAGVSDRYTFIPTTRVIDTLQSNGWNPVWGSQSRSRTTDGRFYAKHILRFQQAGVPAAEVGGYFPEIVLTNSHNRASSFKIMAGIFRLVCGNGLIVANSTFEAMTIVHIGYNNHRVVMAQRRVLNSLPGITKRMDVFQNVALSQPEQLAFASAAMELRYPEEQKPFQAAELLTPRRMEDKDPSLWNTLNCVQENMLKGGIRYRSMETRRRNSTRAVTSVNEDVRLNRALWTLADELAKAKGALSLAS